jgi:predicted RNase H-like nuclease
VPTLLAAIRHCEQMSFVGLDLAWGEKKPTGVAVLDSEGQLVHIDVAGRDPSIYAQLAPWVKGPCLVAIDAPLIVKNPEGNRRCEKELNRDFHAFDAGALPANTGREEFKETPRGARIAEALGLDIDPDPDSKEPRRAVEVYPHPATVALFRLGRTLKYKQKRNRTIVGLKSELLRLIGLIEALADADVSLCVAENPEWIRLRRLAENATTKAELRRVEDPVDAVLCAYIARYATERRADCTVYGDTKTGYILTPTKPPDLRPEPPRRATDPETAEDETDADLLHSVRRAAHDLETAEIALNSTVARFRQTGGSWTQIADALTLTVDQAKLRFG